MPVVIPLLFQDFRPIKNVCAHLNAFHVYANDTSRFVEANHYCAHLNEGGFSSHFLGSQDKTSACVWAGCG